MPYVNIKVTPPGLTAQEKGQVIAGVTKVLADVLGKDPEKTFVVIDELPTDNWGVGGETVTERKAKG